MGPEEATSIGLKEVGDGGFCADNRMSLYAGVTQLVEYLLPKQDAAGSSPVARSSKKLPPALTRIFHEDCYYERR